MEATIAQRNIYFVAYLQLLIFPRMWRPVLSVLAAAAVVSSSPQPRISCDECQGEMHRLSQIIRHHAPELQQYVAENYCPTLPQDQHEQCTHQLAHSYVDMLNMVVQVVENNLYPSL